MCLLGCREGSLTGSWMLATWLWGWQELQRLELINPHFGDLGVLPKLVKHRSVSCRPQIHKSLKKKKKYNVSCLVLSSFTMASPQAICSQLSQPGCLCCRCFQRLVKYPSGSLLLRCVMGGSTPGRPGFISSAISPSASFSPAPWVFGTISALRQASPSVAFQVLYGASERT